MLTPSAQQWQTGCACAPPACSYRDAPFGKRLRRVNAPATRPRAPAPRLSAPRPRRRQRALAQLRSAPLPRLRAHWPPRQQSAPQPLRRQHAPAQLCSAHPPPGAQSPPRLPAQWHQHSCALPPPPRRRRPQSCPPPWPPPRAARARALPWPPVRRLQRSGASPPARQRPWLCPARPYPPMLRPRPASRAARGRVLFPHGQPRWLGCRRRRLLGVSLTQQLVLCLLGVRARLDGCTGLQRLWRRGLRRDAVAFAVIAEGV
mmetsp:Transcript_34538/g.86133  ORF Transcript_34538/g.86133 Transcript_34538/m.86133 type:complete len:260 (-) Transcript_34538:427-1206(-)